MRDRSVELAIANRSKETSTIGPPCSPLSLTTRTGRLKQEANKRPGKTRNSTCNLGRDAKVAKKYPPIEAEIQSTDYEKCFSCLSYFH